MTDTNDYRDSTSAVFDPWRLFRSGSQAPWRILTRAPTKRTLHLRSTLRPLRYRAHLPRPPDSCRPGGRFLRARRERRFSDWQCDWQRRWLCGWRCVTGAVDSVDGNHDRRGRPDHDGRWRLHHRGLTHDDATEHDSACAGYRMDRWHDHGANQGSGWFVEFAGNPVSRRSEHRNAPSWGGYHRPRHWWR